MSDAPRLDSLRDIPEQRRRLARLAERYRGRAGGEELDAFVGLVDFLADLTAPVLEGTLAKFDAYSGAKDRDRRNVGAILGAMGVRDATLITYFLKEPPRKPGPKGPRQSSLDVQERALSNLRGSGREPTLNELAAEVTRLKGLPEEKITNQRRNLRRRRKREGT